MENSVKTRKEKILIAIKCVEHILWINDNYIEQTQSFVFLLNKAYQWYHDEISIQEARNFAFNAHRESRNELNEVNKLIYRAIGHTIATAHVQRHCEIAKYYCLKAIRLFVKDEKIVNTEINFQNSL